MRLGLGPLALLGLPYDRQLEAVGAMRALDEEDAAARGSRHPGESPPVMIPYSRWKMHHAPEGAADPEEVAALMRWGDEDGR